MNTTHYKNQKFETGKLRKCWMCKVVLTRGTASVDHLQPKSKGGSNSPNNFRLACKSCNSARGNKSMSKEQRLALRGNSKPKPRDFSALTQAIQRTRQS